MSILLWKESSEEILSVRMRARAKDCTATQRQAKYKEIYPPLYLLRLQQNRKQF